MNLTLNPTAVFDSYWRFAAERLKIYYKKITDPVGPWTKDPILREYRFTNTYRAADRVSQYLIREVQYREDRSQSPDEVFFRTLLFKIFNKIDTWEAIEKKLGGIAWQSANFDTIARELDGMLANGQRIYSAAYIMPSPAFGHERKHSNHLGMLSKMMSDGLPSRLARATSLQNAYEMLRGYSGLGPFLAFQYAVDLNYSTLLNFDESDFVVAGPGAIDGIAKCFENIGHTPCTIIHAMVERQYDEFDRLGLDFKGLYGRALQPIDCQNLFCEISKYARVAYPDIAGASGRTRIKQRYRVAESTLEADPYFPPKWNLSVPLSGARSTKSPRVKQLSFL
jgi:hypothetical protein